MSTLLEQIDNMIINLNEALSKSEAQKVVDLAKTVDPNVFNDIKWSTLDDKWNQLVKACLSRSSISNNITKTYLIAQDAVDANNNPITDNYVKWNDQTKEATLTSKENASLVMDGSPFDVALISRWLDKDPVTKDYKYKQLVKTKEKVNKFDSNAEATLDEVIAYYYELATGENYSKVPDYWKRAIQNDVAGHKNITNSKMLAFIIAATKTTLNGKSILSILSDELISRISWSLINENHLDGSQLKAINKLFVLAALYSGCFEGLSVDDALQLFDTFRMIKQSYGKNYVRNNVDARLSGDSEEAKAITLAENLILTPKKASLDENPIIVAMNNAVTTDEKSEEALKINPIKIDELSKYRANKKSEITSILKLILNPDGLEEEYYWLIVNDKEKYKLIPEDGKLILSGVDLKLEQNSLIKVAYGNSKLAVDSDNLFTVDNLDTAIIFIDSDKFNAADYFTIRDSEVYSINNTSLALRKSNKLIFVADEKDNRKIARMIIDAKPKEIEQSEEDKTAEEKTQEIKRDKLISYAEAVINYLKEHKTKALPTDRDVEKFIKGRQSAIYEAYKNAIYNELEKNPEFYLFDADKKEIKDIKNTMLEILIDILNGKTDVAKGKLDNRETSSNISDNIKINYRKLRAPKWKSTDVASKLQTLANILNQDKSNITNKIDDSVKNQLDKDELAKLIAWFNSRFAKSNQAEIDKNPEIK